MKTIKISLGIALMVVTSGIWAQEHATKDGRFSRDNQVQILTADYRSEMSGVEEFIHRVHGWLMPEKDRGYYEAPEVSMSFFFEHAEVVYDRGSSVEAWMTVPFETALSEEVVALESWMATPFEKDLIEEPLALESWMLDPFEDQLAEEPLALESWMLDPFEDQLTEEPLALESWMTLPFDIIRDCEKDSWMANSPR